jgi:hypothetical protein
MTADLAEEHSTSTLATERLEAETADRLRLEKELQDVQVSRKSYVIFVSCHSFILQRKICDGVGFALFRCEIFCPVMLAKLNFLVTGIFVICNTVPKSITVYIKVTKKSITVVPSE